MADGLAAPEESLRIFISYRRDDASSQAGRLYDALADTYGRNQVFMDVDTILVGTDFTIVLQEAIDRADVVIVLVGRSWVTATDRMGRSRLQNPNDLVRLELEMALTRNASILPVLVQGAEMPTAEDLPPSLIPLVRRHALEIADRRWHSDLTELKDALKRLAAERSELARRDADEQARQEQARSDADERARQEQARRERGRAGATGDGHRLGNDHRTDFAAPLKGFCRRRRTILQANATAGAWRRGHRYCEAACDRSDDRYRYPCDRRHCCDRDEALGFRRASR